MTIFTLYFIFTKLVGWKEPSEVLNGEVIRRKYPPDHITLGCIGTELSAENLEEIAKVVDETEFEGVQVQAVATTEFGPNTVVLMQFRKCSDEKAFRRLDAHCTREGQSENRIYHATAPVKRDADGNLVKKFDDVDDDRFLFWKQVVESLPSWKGLDDTEIFKRVSLL